MSKDGRPYHPLSTILDRNIDRNRKTLLFSQIFSIMGTCDFETFNQLTKIILIIYDIFDSITLREQISIDVYSGFKTLSPDRKILFIQNLEKGDSKNKILDYVLFDIADVNSPHLRHLKNGLSGIDKLINLYYKAGPANRNKRNNIEMENDIIIDYDYYNYGSDDEKEEDENIGSMEVYIVAISQYLQSLIYTHDKKLTTATETKVDWVKISNETDKFSEEILKNDDILNRNLVKANLKIMKSIVLTKKLANTSTSTTTTTATATTPVTSLSAPTPTTENPFTNIENNSNLISENP
eukprot:gene4199-5255_t